MNAIHSNSDEYSPNHKSVLWAILAKDASHVLNLYLDCLMKQNYDKKKIWLYIRTNDNNDETESILMEFVSQHGSKYMGVTFLNESIDPQIMIYANHEWNSLRLRVMAQIRQESLDFAHAHGFDFYFSSDVDNFLLPATLDSLVALNLPVVAPLLKMAIPRDRVPGSNEIATYTTYQDALDESGGFLESQRYPKFVLQEMKGIFQVNLVHCTYLVKSSVYNRVDYAFIENNWEYRNFSLSLRCNDVPQYIDARKFYGALTLSEAVLESIEILSQLASEYIENVQNLTNKQYISLSQNTFYKKFVLTLPEFEKRHIEFKKNNPHLHNFEWFYSQNPRELAERYSDSDDFLSKLDSKTLSCFMGHRGLWERCVDLNEPIIILEDDVVSLRDLDYILFQSLQRCSQNVDMIYLGFNWNGFVFSDPFEGNLYPVKFEFKQSSLYGNLNRIANLAYESFLHPLEVAWGLCGYFLNPSGAKKLLEGLETQKSDRFIVPKIGFDLPINTTDSYVNSLNKEVKRRFSFPPLVFVENHIGDSLRIEGNH